MSLRPAIDTSRPRTRRRRRLAAALRYVSGETALPLVVAKGEGAIAERIIALAQEHNVPLATDGDLAELLAQIDLGESIPAEAIAAVAAILLPILKLSQKLRGSP